MSELIALTVIALGTFLAVFAGLYLASFYSVNTSKERKKQVIEILIMCMIYLVAFVAVKFRC